MAENGGLTTKQVVDFWKRIGSVYPASQWESIEKDHEIYSYLNGKKEPSGELRNCREYLLCCNKWGEFKKDSPENQNEKEPFDFNEGQVQWDRLKTPNDVAYYIVISEWPRFLLSKENQHTRHWVVQKFDNEGVGISNILKIAEQRREGVPDKPKEETKNENLNENSNESSDEKNQESPEEKKLTAFIIHRHEPGGERYLLDDENSMDNGVANEQQNNANRTRTDPQTGHGVDDEELTGAENSQPQ